MKTVSIRRLLNSLAGIALLAVTMVDAPVAGLADEDGGAKVKPAAMERLPNVPGKSISAVLVSYAPGGKSPKHHHAGSVLAYVLTGAIRS